ncbi:MAG: IS5 family transposase [Saprospiraceae bacterium]|nr:IS5 family transposase [Saprospiraceae bacterium]
MRNWQEYTNGLKRRGSLTIWVDESVSASWYHQGPVKRGGQQVYSSECIVLLLTLKATFGLAFRQLEGFAESIFVLMGLDLQVPSYTQICRRQLELKVPLGVSGRLKNGESIHLVVDSSGLKVYGECEWKVRKHGWGKRRTWRKIHLGVDEKTGEITAQVLTDNKTDDAAVLEDLVVNTIDEGVDISKVGTDGAYDHYDCWDMLVEMEIKPIIPPRENAVYQLDDRGGLIEHPRNRTLEIIDRGGMEANRKDWKVQSGYHRRSKSENVFFRWKTILGEKMYARVFENQQAEAAVKAAILNKFIQIASPKAVKVA